MSSSPDVTATFCATLVDEWRRAGVVHAVLSPGSRSTPLALALADSDLAVHVHLDERSAGFLGLGIGLGSGQPAIVLTTSGTAAVELHPAVVEAHQARVPLIVVTADRPPELQDVGAPQTIDQTHLFGRSVRWFAAPGVPDDDIRATWRRLAARAVAEARGAVPGPVHLNLAFREPLVGMPGPLDDTGDGAGLSRPVVAVDRPRPAAPRGEGLEELRVLAAHERGVVVAGHGIRDPAAVVALADALGWPLVADPRSGARRLSPTTVAAADAILRHCPPTGELRPDVVLRFGAPPASKMVNQWLAATGAEQVLVRDHAPWVDPDHSVGRILDGDAATLGPLLTSDRPAPLTSDRAWLRSWMQREEAAQAAIETGLADHDEPTEPGLARALMAALPAAATLVASSSMPVRDLEWYSRPRTGVRVLANRGANGIDGVTSTAVGVALASDQADADQADANQADADQGSGPTVLLIGDLAFLHDSNALLGLARRPVDLTIVVVDNDGGGIFSFLPQRRAVASERFEQLLGTPHGIDLGALAAVHGLAVERPATAAEVVPAIDAGLACTGPTIVHVRTDRAANVAVHDEVHAAVAAAIDALG